MDTPTYSTCIEAVQTNIRGKSDVQRSEVKFEEIASAQLFTAHPSRSAHLPAKQKYFFSKYAGLIVEKVIVPGDIYDKLCARLKYNALNLLIAN